MHSFSEGAVFCLLNDREALCVGVAPASAAVCLLYKYAQVLLFRRSLPSQSQQ